MAHVAHKITAQTRVSVLSQYGNMVCNSPTMFCVCPVSYYKVKYQDGDTEEYTGEEIGKMLHKTKRNTYILRALPATKRERSIEEHASMETIYIPPSQFLGELSKVMEYVEIIALEAVNTGFGTVRSQEYKWAKMTIDKETEDAVDLNKLLKHPKYTET